MKTYLKTALMLSLLSCTAARAQPDSQLRLTQNDQGGQQNTDWKNHHGPTAADQNANDRRDRQKHPDQNSAAGRSSNDRASRNQADKQRPDAHYPTGNRHMRADESRWSRSGDRNHLWNQRYSRTYTYKDDSYYQQCRSQPDPAGVIVGGLIGGLLGNSAGHGRTGATVAGVIVGGGIGAALTSNLDCRDRSYAYKAYYRGFNAGRANTNYNWRDPRNSHRGTFHVGRYYSDPDGFHCATYSQTAYIGGRRHLATGRACRQPDGTWAIVN